MGATQSALFKHGFHSKSKNVESWALVWLDESNPVSTDAAQTLRGVINRLEIFQDTRTCKKYIKSLSKDDRLIVLVSQRCGPEIVPQIQSYRQVASIFVYIPTGRTENEEWIRKFSKVNKEKNIISHRSIDRSFVEGQRRFHQFGRVDLPDPPTNEMQSRGTAVDQYLHPEQPTRQIDQ